MYIVDYKVLEGIPEKKGNHSAQPLGLLYVDKSGDLVPIAIQLLQQSGDTNPIWTPSDLQYDWLLAKMWLRYADNTIQQVFRRSQYLITELFVFTNHFWPVRIADFFH